MKQSIERAHIAVLFTVLLLTSNLCQSFKKVVNFRSGPIRTKREHCFGHERVLCNPFRLYFLGQAEVYSSSNLFVRKVPQTSYEHRSQIGHSIQAKRHRNFLKAISDNAYNEDKDKTVDKDSELSLLEDEFIRDEEFDGDNDKNLNEDTVIGIDAEEEGEEDGDGDGEEDDDEELNALIAMALGPEHVEMLNRKVEAAMEEEWDRQQGVNTMSTTATMTSMSGLNENEKDKAKDNKNNAYESRMGGAIGTDVAASRSNNRGYRKKPPLKANLDLWTFQARQQFIRGNYTAAMLGYQKCTDYDPRDGRAWLGLGRIYWKRGRSDQAERMYKEGLYYDPKNPFLLQAYAVMSEKLGDISKARNLLLKSVKANPRHAASWVALAGINRRLGDVSSARYCYSSAVSGDSASYVALQAWGSLEADVGKIDEARDLFARALEIGAKSVHTYHAWAQLEKNQGNYTQAMNLLEQALLIKNAKKGKPIDDENPQRQQSSSSSSNNNKENSKASTRILLSIAEILQLQNTEDWKVRDVFLQGEDTAERFGDSGFFQAWAMYEIKLLKEMELRHRAQNKLWRGSESQQQQERKDAEQSQPQPQEEEEEEVEEEENDALQIVDDDGSFSAEKSAPFSSSTIVTMGALREKSSSIRRLFKRAVTINKYHSASWVSWAKFEQRSGNFDVARKLLITGISNFPHSKNIGYFHSALGQLSRAQGDISTARACYNRAVQATSIQKSLPILIEFARMEISAGSPLEARRVLDLAEKRFPNNESVELAVQELAATGWSNRNTLGSYYSPLKV